MTALSDIFYEGYRIPLVGDSVSTVSKTIGQEYEEFHAGSLPLAIVLADGDASIVTITELEAHETDECIIGGAPIYSGRIGNDWFAIERPLGTADADVEFFYKGNLLTAKRFGTKTYL